ncbi:hypothetical protein D3C77_400730 [compost metagenome]
MSSPVIPVASNGMIRIGLSPSKFRGSLMMSLSHFATYPARKPAAIPPINPAPTCEASMPPTSPGARPGFSAMEKAMYPARIGIISAKAAPPPISINAAANVPFSLAASIPKMNEIAINNPPATTNGSIADTPVIRCL